jgi:hypothetical protein
MLKRWYKTEDGKEVEEGNPLGLFLSRVETVEVKPQGKSKGKRAEDEPKADELKADEPKADEQAEQGQKKK